MTGAFHTAHLIPFAPFLSLLVIGAVLDAATHRRKPTAKPKRGADMATRITHKDLDRIAASVSEGMRGWSVSPQGRNGYVALDVYDSAGRQVDTLHLGTTRECYTYLQGMRRAQLFARYGAREG
jgi:hypothetical protein